MQKTESFLPAIFELRVGSGRGMGKIRALQHEQLLLDEDRCGSIAWKAAHDVAGSGGWAGPQALE